MSYIDLHMHSSYSDDGEFKPNELVELCLKRGIKYFSIADHNSVKAIYEAKEYCKNKDIEIIPAVELDCTINGEMIAEAAMEFDKDKSNPLLKPYYEGGSRSDNPFVNFYWDYCAQGKPAYVEVKFMTLQEAIKIVEENGGDPILAHPGNNVKEDDNLLEDIIACGIKGMEVYSSYHKENQIEYYKKYAIKHKLIATCGSDFHGKTKPSISIGSSECEGNEEEIILGLNNLINNN